MYLEIFLADFTVFRVFWGISRDFAEIPEFRGSATARNIRSPALQFTSTVSIESCEELFIFLVLNEYMYLSLSFSICSEKW